MHPLAEVRNVLVIAVTSTPPSIFELRPRLPVSMTSSRSPYHPPNSRNLWPTVSSVEQSDGRPHGEGNRMQFSAGFAMFPCLIHSQSEVQ